LTERVAVLLRENAADFIRDISFDSLWSSFWNASGNHLLVEHSHKVAMVYAYNEETKHYIGGFIDKSGRKDMDLFRKEHSVLGKETLVFDGEILVDAFVKEDDIHCYPIFPRNRPNSDKQTHSFGLAGYEYYTDCKNVRLEKL
jgi:hypothetical protein